jgi:hypothetical protein
MIAVVLATGPAGGNAQRFISTFVSVATALHPHCKIFGDLVAVTNAKTWLNCPAVLKHWIANPWMTHHRFSVEGSRPIYQRQIWVW